MNDIYVEFGTNSDILGETEDKDFKAKKAIEVTSFGHKITQPKSATASTAGGHTSARTEHGEVIVTKKVDSASAKIWQACSAGSVYQKVIISFFRATGGMDKVSAGQKNERTNYLTIELRNVLISSVNANISDESELVSETVGLKYAAIKWTYRKSNVKGAGTSAVAAEGAWDLSQNIAAF